MITIILGSMFSGKTTTLLAKLERATFAKKKVILLRPETDNRTFLTHSRLSSSIEEVFVKDINEFDCSNYDTIGIDEGQFHKGLREFCVNASLNGKQVFISALHATSESEMFEEIIKIIPHCDKIIKLNAVCTRCGSDLGNYSFLLSGSKTEKVLIGGNDKFTALCRKCYFENNL